MLKSNKASAFIKDSYMLGDISSTDKVCINSTYMQEYFMLTGNFILPTERLSQCPKTWALSKVNFIT